MELHNVAFGQKRGITCLPLGRKNLLCVPPLAEWKKLDTKHLFCCVLRAPNRRLLSRKTEFDFVQPYDLIPKYLPAVAEKAQEGRAFCEARPAESWANEQTNCL